jgi:4-diphosphocytidyl-2C-methyl-D-erythritol kinase
VMGGGVTDWPAPAKLNLFLHVTGRRPDGYHELQTLFQLIDLRDTVTIRVGDDGRIERPSGPVGVDPDSDLTVRAAKALQAATGSRMGASIRIAKRIPMWGELGCRHGAFGAQPPLGLRALYRRARARGAAAGRGCPCFR